MELTGSVFVGIREEAVESRHDFWLALAEELAEPVLAIPLPFFRVLQDLSGPMSLVDPVRKTVEILYY